MINSSILSIDFGSKNIKIIVGKHQGYNVLVEKAITVPTPTNGFNDGKIMDIDIIKRSIYSALSQYKIKARKAVCTIQSTSIITREIVLPYAKEDELDMMVRYEIEQYLPIVLDDYIIEYKILESFIDKEVNKLRILVAALPKAIGESYLTLIKDLKLKPVALDINTNALSKLFSKPININDENYSLDKTVAVINIGYNSINVSIISKGTSQFDRLIPLGSRDIDISIANYFNLSLEEAEKKKLQDCTLNEEESLLASSAMLNDAVRATIDNWIQEVNRIFQYYIFRTTGNKIDQIYILGEGSKIRGLTNYISRTINLPTYSILKVSNVKLGEKARGIDIGDYLNSIGALIRL